MYLINFKIVERILNCLPDQLVLIDVHFYFLLSYKSQMNLRLIDIQFDVGLFKNSQIEF